MAFMHQHGVMHRDLKPQNLLVDPGTNVLKIADLGLGRVFALPVKAYTHEVCLPPLRSVHTQQDLFVNVRGTPALCLFAWLL